MSELISFYLRLALRRAPVMIVIVLVCCVVAVTYAVSLPNQYRASAMLLVESPQIPDELAASTVTTETAEQLGIIQQSVLRRENLIDVANKFDLFRDGEDRSPDEIGRLMRASTSIDSSVRRGQATFMTISFTYSDRDVVAAVVNDYVTRVLDANVRLRTERAGNTLEFFEQEVDRLSRELAEQSGRISKFKAENSNTLPDSLAFRLSRQAALEERILGLQRERDSLDEQRDRVTSVYQETGRLRTPEANLTPEQRQLRDLESELSSALAVYSESNPRVTVLRTRIEQLRKVVEGQNADGSAADPGTSVYDITIAELDARANSLDSQIEYLTSEAEVLQDRIERTPLTAIELETLERQYTNVQNQYDGAVARLARAKTGEQIELTAQGQRITLAEAPIAPEWPESPNRKVIAAAGGLAGVGAAAGLFALLELLNSTIRRPAELVSRIGIAPLATIPYIETRRQRMMRRALQIATVLLFFVVAPAAIWAMHQYVMPLDEVVQLAKTLLRDGSS